MVELDNAIAELIKSEPFFGYLLLRMRKHLDSKKVPTAGVNITSKGINLYVNPEFFASQTHEQRKAVIKHECMHILHNHIARSMKSKLNHHVDNIAMDCAINQYIKDLPEMCVTLDSFNKALKVNALPYHAFEYYRKLFKENAKVKQMEGEMDDHSLWEESDLTPEEVSEREKQAIKTAKGDAAGNISSELDSLINERLKSTVNWKSQLKSFFTNAEEVVQEETRKKRNRRYGILYPGQRSVPKLKIAICVDTSGSVSDLMLSQFFAELMHISQVGNCEMWVIEADCEVKSFYKFDKKAKVTFKGRGGTAYQPAIDKAKELGCDGIIYFGDGDSADTPNRPAMPFLWAMVNDCKPPVSWGKTIQVRVDENSSY